MGGGHQGARGSGMRARILNVAVAVVRRAGFRALSMRSIAAEAGCTLGAIQFHFDGNVAFAREVIRMWAQCVNCELEEAASGQRGLKRAWRLCEQWVRLPESTVVSMQDAPSSAEVEGHDTARGALVEALRHWVRLTRWSLRQAEHDNELRDGVCVEAAAVELHRILWSHGWSAAVFGEEESRSAILETIRRQLTSIARDPEHCQLPARTDAPTDAFKQLDTVAPAAIFHEPQPIWRTLYEPSDAEYHAHVRLELGGDPRTYVLLNDIVPEDVEKAVAYATANGLVAGIPTGYVPPSARPDPKSCVIGASIRLA